MKRDLFVSAFAPVMGSGRALRTYTTVRALAALGPVDLAFVPFKGTEPSKEFLAIDGLDFHEIEPSRGVGRVAVYGRKRLEGVPKDVARGCSPELIAAAERMAQAPQRGRVIAGDLYSMAALMPLARAQPVIYNSHNVESSYRHDQNGKRVWSWLSIAHTERRVLRRAAESWMVSHADMDRARRLAPGARLRYVPNVVDVAAIAPAPAPSHEGAPTVLMVADYSYSPNAVGLALLAQDIMPRVWDKIPDARLTLLGRGADPAVTGDPRIDVLGYVDDLGAAYATAGAVAVPLTEGGGTPLKFVEALAYGKAIVATPLAAAGLHVQPDVHFACGADPSAFAAELVRVLLDHPTARALGEAARALAEQEYSVETVTRLIAA